ncbi:AraC family transcriptional regulator [Paenibacillus kandeliae]|uniref:AraC family transcriptional regulator n=1 Tax=Paenibacillus kandeliae TaxID=3231269 RepID=UPI00345A75DE
MCMEIWQSSMKQPVSYFKSGKFVCEDNWYHERLRLEQDYEVIIGISGCLYIEVEGQRYTVGAGDMLFYRPGQLHGGYAPSSSDSSFYWLHFFTEDAGRCVEEQQMRAQWQEAHLLEDGGNLSPLSHSILLPTFLNLHQPEKVFMQCQQLLDIAHSRHYSHLAADYTVTGLLIELTRQYIEQVTDSQEEHSGDRRFRQVLEWIKLHIGGDLTVHEVAEQFGYTPDHVTRLFRKRLGISTLKYINDMKISRSKELLLHSDASIKEIAYTLHFQDEKYFMKLFKATEGITPSQYRDAYPNTYMNTNSTDPDIPLPAHLQQKNPIYKGTRPYV